MRLPVIFLFFLLATQYSYSQQQTFSTQDSLRGGYGIGRSNWDLLHYELSVIPDFEAKSLSGTNLISFRMLSKGPIQIDLQEPMIIDRISLNGEEKKIYRDGNVYLIDNTLDAGAEGKLRITFHGSPVVAKRPPWDGGWIFTKDKEGNPWMTVACQGLGASCWFPCKDSQQDEPDNGCLLHIETPDTLSAVGPGRPAGKVNLPDNKMRYSWKVVSPINNYSIIPYIGKYADWQEEYIGEKGRLILDYRVLAVNKTLAQEHFKQVPGMLKAFEHWFGPYPFYEDSYKLVEAPFAGMEHQSGIAYGNGYRNGYAGRDLSGTGAGKKWDFMIVHESGHEWFGNSITSKDIADIWIHESFTSYAEVLYTEYNFGKKDANDYCIGYRKSIENIHPCIGAYGVQDDPADRTSDMYAKGSAMLHTIRQICDNDEKFRMMLRELNRSFYHKTVSTTEIEEFVCRQTGIDRTVFDQYLRTTMIPELEYRTDKKGKNIFYRWTNVVNEFNMEVRMVAGKKSFRIRPGKKWEKTRLNKGIEVDAISPDPLFYINYKRM